MKMVEDVSPQPNHCVLPVTCLVLLSPETLLTIEHIEELLP